MEPIYALTVGLMVAISIYLLLSRHLLRIIFGLMILGNAVNLAIFTVGRITGLNPPFVLPHEDPNALSLSNALPQALILTAIVIGFGMVAFALSLVLRVYRDIGSLETEVSSRNEEHNAQAPMLHDGRVIEEDA